MIPSEAVVDRALEHDLVSGLLRAWLRAERDLVAKVDRLHRALDLGGVGAVPDPERREARLKAAARAKVSGQFGEWYLADAGVENADRLVVREYGSRAGLVEHLAGEARNLGLDDDYDDEHVARAVARTHFETDLDELADLVVGFDEDAALRSCLVGGLRRAERGIDEAVAAVEGPDDPDPAGRDHLVDPGGDGGEEGSDDGGEEGSDDGGEEGSDDGGDGGEEGSEDGGEEGSEDGGEDGSDDGGNEGSGDGRA